MNNLASIRRERGYRQSDFADFLGIDYIDRETISRMENNYILPIPEDAETIAHKLGVTVADIWPDYHVPNAVYAPAPSTSPEACAHVVDAKYYIDVVSHIPLGKENAILRRELEALTGLEDRENRKRIRAARRAGYPIIPSRRGYYFSSSPEEVRRFCSTLYAKGNDEIQTANAMLHFYDKPQVTGQVALCVKCGDDSQSGLCDNCKTFFTERENRLGSATASAAQVNCQADYISAER